MIDIRTKAGAYYLALSIGYTGKSDVIKWADFCIEHFEVPYDFIDLSLSGSKSIDDTLSNLKRIYGKDEFVIPMSIMLGLIRSEFIKHKISVDNFFTYIYRLYTHGCMSDKDVNEFSFLDRLSDGYYLATEGIYGSIKDIVQEAIDELERFEEYQGHLER
jgi:hypothetical protein